MDQAIAKAQVKAREVEFQAGTLSVLENQFKYISKHRQHVNVNGVGHSFNSLDEFVIAMAMYGAHTVKNSVESAIKTRKNNTYMAEKARLADLRGTLGNAAYFEALDRLDQKFGVGGTRVELS
jgi:hypothetical protein